MTLQAAITKLQAIAAQAPTADFDFVFLEYGYGYEVTDILYDSETNRGIVIITDQPL